MKMLTLQWIATSVNLQISIISLIHLNITMNCDCNRDCFLSSVWEISIFCKFFYRPVAKWQICYRLMPFWFNHCNSNWWTKRKKKHKIKFHVEIILKYIKNHFNVTNRLFRISSVCSLSACLSTRFFFFFFMWSNVKRKTHKKIKFQISLHNRTNNKKKTPEPTRNIEPI